MGSIRALLDTRLWPTRPQTVGRGSSGKDDTRRWVACFRGPPGQGGWSRPGGAAKAWHAPQVANPSSAPRTVRVVVLPVTGFVTALAAVATVSGWLTLPP